MPTANDKAAISQYLKLCAHLNKCAHRCLVPMTSACKPRERHVALHRFCGACLQTLPLGFSPAQDTCSKHGTVYVKVTVGQGAGRGFAWGCVDGGNCSGEVEVAGCIAVEMCQ
eukprot:scaffold186860_cov22-Tisochrysis_lutea.AAC.1